MGHECLVKMQRGSHQPRRFACNPFKIRWAGGFLRSHGRPSRGRLRGRHFRIQGTLGLRSDLEAIRVCVAVAGMRKRRSGGETPGNAAACARWSQLTSDTADRGRPRSAHTSLLTEASSSSSSLLLPATPGAAEAEAVDEASSVIAALCVLLEL